MSQNPIRRFLRPTRPWVWLISVFVLYTLLGALVAPLVIEHQAKKFVQERLDSEVRFGEIELNPFALSLEISEFELSDESGQILAFENIYVDFQLLSYLRSRLIDFRTIELSALALNLQRNQDGSTNIEALVERLNQTATEQVELDSTTEESAAPINLLLRNLAIVDSTINIADNQPQIPMELAVEDIKFQLDNLSLSSDQPADIALALNLSSGGTLNLEAGLVISPEFDLQMQFEITDLALLPLQSYIAETTQIELDSGFLNLSGEILSSATEPLSYQGALSIDELDLQHEGESLLAWQQLLLPNNDFSISENRLNISEIILQNAYAKTEIDFAGGNNISKALAASDSNTDSSSNSDTDLAEPAAVEEVSEQEPSESMAISIGDIQINAAQMHFADFSLPLPFIAEISALNGNISTISNVSSEPATLDLEGQVGEFGLVEMSGRLRPLNYQDLTQIDLSFSNVSMLDLSPYLVKFAGRTVESGKMDVDLSYLIEAGQLDGDNAMVLSDFQLGESVDSPDALNLPLGLALALLKNSDGVIDLQLPVSGDLGDPEFSYGSVIRTAFVNLITNIVSSPFRFLGSLIGSDEPLDSIEFEASEFELRPPEQEKLLALSNALVERPQLSLEVSPGFNRRTDQLALQETELNRQIEQQILQIEDADLSNLDKRIAALEALAINYQAVTDPQLDKLAYASELEQHLLDSAPIPTELEFETLANNRATEIQNYLVESEPALAERINISAEVIEQEDDSEVLTILLSLTGA